MKTKKRNIKEKVKKSMQPWVKNVLSTLAIAIFGFILLNLTFLLDFAFQTIIRSIVGIFVPLGPETNLFWMPPLTHISFVVLICLISFFIFKSKLKVIYKAIYMVVPITVILATLGIFLYKWPMILYPLGAFFCLGVLYLFYKTKQPWIYYYVVMLVSIVLTIFTLSGGEI